MVAAVLTAGHVSQAVLDGKEALAASPACEDATGADPEAVAATDLALHVEEDPDGNVHHHYGKSQPAAGEEPPDGCDESQDGVTADPTGDGDGDATGSGDGTGEEPEDGTGEEPEDGATGEEPEDGAGEEPEDGTTGEESEDGATGEESEDGAGEEPEDGAGEEPGEGSEGSADGSGDSGDPYGDGSGDGSGDSGDPSGKGSDDDPGDSSGDGSADGSGDQGGEDSGGGDSGGGDSGGLDVLGRDCADSSLEPHDGFQEGPRCVDTAFGEVPAEELVPTLLVTDAPSLVGVGEDFTIQVSTRNLIRDRFLPAAEGGFLLESSRLTEEGLVRGHFHTACRILSSNQAPDPAPAPAFFAAVEDGGGGSEPDLVNVEIAGLEEPGSYQCTVWAGDGSHRVPMAARANQIPPVDAIRVTVN